MSKKYPGESNLSVIFQLIEDKINSLKELIKSSNNGAAEFFYVNIKLGASGFELDNVTYTEIAAAYNEGKRIVGRTYVPSAAGLGFSGFFDLPMTYAEADFVLSFITGTQNVEVFITSTNTVNVIIRDLQEKSNCFQTIANNANSHAYPSVNAVYNFLGGKKIVYSSLAPTIDDKSVTTIVL